MKILIVNSNLVMGGVETSILNFISNIGSDNQVDLMLLNKSGDLISQIPKKTQIIDAPQELACFGQVVSGKSKWFLKPIKFVAKKLGFKNLKDKKDLSVFNIIKNWSLDSQYDVVISFNAFDVISNELVLNKINAKTKICIVHSDVNRITLSRVVVNQFKMFDWCLGCSDSCVEKIKKKYKHLENTGTLYNFQNNQKIIEGAKESDNGIIEKKVFSFGTVARLYKHKAPIRQFKVVKKLVKEGYNFNFYWIGDGSAREVAEKFIQKNKLSNIKLLGNQQNPYKFLKNLNVFVLTSLYEAAPMVYSEAMTVGVPVLTTNTCSANELVGERGWVCDNNFKSIYKSFKSILDNQEQVEAKKKMIEGYLWDNEKIKKDFVTKYCCKK